MSVATDEGEVGSYPDSTGYLSGEKWAVRSYCRGHSPRLPTTLCHPTCPETASQHPGVLSSVVHLHSEFTKFNLRAPLCIACFLSFKAQKLELCMKSARHLSHHSLLDDLESGEGRRAALGASRPGGSAESKRSGCHI